MKVEVAVLGFPSLISLVVSVDVLPSNGHENNTAEPKTDKLRSSPSQLLFCTLIKGINSHVIFCPNKQSSCEPFMCLDLVSVDVRQH